jgi:hypothetical protein
VIDASSGGRPSGRPSGFIAIYCDGAKHHPRRVPVTNFRQMPGGGWHEEPASRAGVTAGTGYTLHGNSVDESGWALDPRMPSQHRVDHDLPCRKCGKPWTLSEQKLFAALDAISGVGVSEVSLVALAGIVQKQAER